MDTTLPITEGMKEILTTLFGLSSWSCCSVPVSQGWRTNSYSPDCCSVSLIGMLSFHCSGFSINTLSLFGLILAIGLVVDDAIVVVGPLNTTSSMD
jgi:multidrug efflux pump